jgi:hypothetical protein
MQQSLRPARSAAITLLAAFVATLVPVAALGFSDVGTGASYSHAINALKERGVVEGYADGTFRERNSINRAEFLKIVLGSRLSVSGQSLGKGQNCFKDVEADDWFAPWVCMAKTEGIVSGYEDGTYKPDQEINFVEASKILSLAFKQQGQGGSLGVSKNPVVASVCEHVPMVRNGVMPNDDVHGGPFVHGAIVLLRDNSWGTI